MRAAGLALLVLAACATASPPQTAGTASRAVSFRSAGYGLEGTLTSPDGRAATAAVLIVGGSGPIDRDGVSRIAVSTPPIYRWWAEGLAAAGFTVFRYDKRFITHPSCARRARPPATRSSSSATAKAAPWLRWSRRGPVQ